MSFQTPAINPGQRRYTIERTEWRNVQVGQRWRAIGGSGLWHVCRSIDHDRLTIGERDFVEVQVTNTSPRQLAPLPALEWCELEVFRVALDHVVACDRAPVCGVPFEIVVASLQTAVAEAIQSIDPEFRK